MAINLKAEILAVGVATLTTTVVGAVMTPNRLGVTGALCLSLPCNIVSLWTLKTLKDSQRHAASKAAMISSQILTTLIILETTCYTFDASYLDVAALVTRGLLAGPVVVVLMGLFLEAIRPRAVFF